MIEFVSGHLPLISLDRHRKRPRRSSNANARRPAKMKRTGPVQVWKNRFLSKVIVYEGIFKNLKKNTNQKQFT